VLGVWDPGISGRHILYSLIPDLKTFPPMHKSGNVIIDNNSYIINECLFDSGAESDNFISQSFIDMNCDILTEFISSHKSIVRLGDSKTTVNITQVITLNVTFVDNNFITHEATLNFLIMPISHIDMIIGINSILYSLFDFFIDMLKVARSNIKKYNNPNPSPHLLDISTSNVILTILIVYQHLIFLLIVLPQKKRKYRSQ
jgi:hypothetical protein